MREPFWLRHDLHVVAIVLLILGVGWVVRGEAGAAPTKQVARDRLILAIPADWIVEPALGEITVARGEDAVTRVELSSAERPSAMVSVESSLELERMQRHGPLYTRQESGRAQIGGHEWLRTVYSYAFKPTPSHAPRLATAVELAAESGGRVLVVTLHAPEEHIARLEREILGSVNLRSGP